VLGLDVGLLAADERPDLVHLNPLAGQAPQRRVLVVRARDAQVEQELGDGVLGRDGEADGRADRVSLD
jgi:hypothetical protein